MLTWHIQTLMQGVDEGETGVAPVLVNETVASRKSIPHGVVQRCEVLASPEVVVASATDTTHEYT